MNEMMLQNITKDRRNKELLLRKHKQNGQIFS
jgi:hypothetical protein